MPLIIALLLRWPYMPPAYGHSYEPSFLSEADAAMPRAMPPRQAVTLYRSPQTGYQPTIFYAAELPPAAAGTRHASRQRASHSHY